MDDSNKSNKNIATKCPICGNKTLIFTGRCGQCQNPDCGYNSCGF